MDKAICKWKVFEGCPILYARMIGDDENPSMHIYFLHAQGDNCSAVYMTEVISWDLYDSLPYHFFEVMPFAFTKDPNSMGVTA